VTGMFSRNSVARHQLTSYNNP